MSWETWEWGSQSPERSNGWSRVTQHIPPAKPGLLPALGLQPRECPSIYRRLESAREPPADRGQTPGAWLLSDRTPPNPQGALSPGPRAVPSLGPRRCRGFLNNAHLILSLSTPAGIFSCPWGVGHNFQGLCAISRSASRLLPDQHTLGSPVSSPPHLAAPSRPS